MHHFFYPHRLGVTGLRGDNNCKLWHFPLLLLLFSMLVLNFNTAQNALIYITHSFREYHMKREQVKHRANRFFLPH